MPDLTPSTNRLHHHPTILNPSVVLACVASLALASVASAEPVGHVESVTPLTLQVEQPSDLMTRIALDDEIYNQLRGASRVTLRGFALDPQRTVDLELERFEVFSPNAVLIVSGGENDRPLDRPEVVLLRGAVIDEPGSRVFLGFSPHGNNGFIQFEDHLYVVSTPRDDVELGSVIYNMTELPAGAIMTDFTCGADLLDGPPIAAPMRGDAAGDNHADPRNLPCRSVDIAVETDWQFTGTLFGGDTAASSAYAAMLIGATSEIYQAQMNTTLNISFLRVWDSSNTLWGGSNGIYDEFFSFRDYWRANMDHVDRHAAHFLSGRNLSGAGGLAYASSLCNLWWAYGISAHLNGFFPYPITHNHSQNWDLLVVAHEIGHNFGAPHTHDMTPPIDQCASGDCSVVPNGTIMGYCHGCQGGVANVRMEFHHRIIDERIMPYITNSAPCDLISGEIPAIAEHPEGMTIFQGQTATFSVEIEPTDDAIAYQWRRGATLLSDDGRITGAQTDTLVINNANQSDQGNYSVLVSSECITVVSGQAMLQVQPVFADMNGDGVVNGADLAILLALWGDCPGNCIADLNSDGVVNGYDLAMLLNAWGAPR